MAKKIPKAAGPDHIPPDQLPNLLPPGTVCRLTTPARCVRWVHNKGNVSRTLPAGTLVVLADEAWAEIHKKNERITICPPAGLECDRSYAYLIAGSPFGWDVLTLGKPAKAEAPKTRTKPTSKPAKPAGVPSKPPTEGRQYPALKAIMRRKASR